MIRDEPTREELLAALRESVRLQAHYAALLNDDDGGRRIVFMSAEEWLDRLRARHPAARDK